MRRALLPAGGARTPSAAARCFRINGSIMSAAPSPPASSLSRHAPVRCLCQSLYFDSSTWHSELVTLRAQPQVAFTRATLIWKHRRQTDRQTRTSCAALLLVWTEGPHRAALLAWRQLFRAEAGPAVCWPCVSSRSAQI